MAFETIAPVRFAHVDLAGSVFYPRYFEMLNGAVEEWFERLGRSFRSMHFEARIGVPIVKLEAQFVGASALGDALTIRLDPLRLGNSSCDVQYRFLCAGELRMRGSMRLVCVDAIARKAIAWPGDLREKIVEDLIAGEPAP